jgi:hypothetical protein
VTADELSALLREEALHAEAAEEWDTLNAACRLCGEKVSAPNKGLGRAVIAAFKSLHQHPDTPRDPSTGLLTL